MKSDDRTDLSTRIAELFFNKVYTEELINIHLFLPINKFNEVDTWILVEGFKAKELPSNLIISKSDFASGRMTNYYYHPQIRLVENKWGVPEPDTGEICDNILIDLVFVPLLAFDKVGHRIGYGKGFYDRFLKTCRQDTLKIGLSFDGPVDVIEDAGENDVQMDCVITPENIYWFKN